MIKLDIKIHFFILTVLSKRLITDLYSLHAQTDCIYLFILRNIHFNLLRSTTENFMVMIHLIVIRLMIMMVMMMMIDFELSLLVIMMIMI